MPIVFDEVVGQVEENRGAGEKRSGEQPPPARPPDPQFIPIYSLKVMVARLQQRLERLMAD
jgi:hypothetical protein